jgi:hypothetical protein
MEAKDVGIHYGATASEDMGSAVVGSRVHKLVSVL